MKKYAIIVAGGSGQRMQSNIPKQFMLLQGKPVLMHTIQNFFNADADISIIVVLPKNQMDYWNDLIHEHHFKIEHQIVSGGDTRFQSVKNGLQLVSTESLIAIHDGVRPLASAKFIQSCFDAALKNGNAIPAIAVNDSVRILTDNGNRMMQRDSLRIVQTPQIFISNIILRAFEREYQESFTDDASVAEAAGHKIFLCEGLASNIKITQAADLKMAEALMHE